MPHLHDDMLTRAENDVVKRDDLVKAVKDAAEIVDEALGLQPKNVALRAPAFELVLSELMAYESDT